MDEVLRTIEIDPRMSQYEGYLPDDWTEAVGATATNTAGLYQIVVDLILAWRTTAYTASMPTVTIKAMRNSTLGYATFHSPDASLIAFGEDALVKVSQRVPELVDNGSLRAKLMETLVTMADDFRVKRAAVTPEMPLEPIWQDMLGEHAFVISVWSSQRVAYVAFYNAYEAFLVDCAKRALGVTQLRAIDKAFLEALRTGFGADLSGTCWGHQEIQIGREVRHALSHAGGRETENLAKHRHGIRLIDGVLQIWPEDNHRLLRRLRASVAALVVAAVVHPKFA